MTDLVIIGAGPAGFSAAIYAVRAGLSVRLLENSLFGGQIINTPDVDNYPGLPGISGAEFAMKLYEHAAKLGVEPETAAVSKAELSGDIKNIFTEKEIIPCRSVIIATGASHRKLGCPGEEEFTGKGVSYCATCDANFFEDFEVYVVGGGDSAVEEAMYLTKFARKVTIIHRRDELRAAKSIQEKAFANPKMNFMWNSTVEEIKGDGVVTSMIIKDTKTGELREVKADEDDGTFGIFVFIGFDPKSQLFEGKLEMNNRYIVTDKYMHTSVPGVFAAGDVIEKHLRQVVTACGDGAVAVTEAQRYIESLED